MSGLLSHHGSLFCTDVNSALNSRPNVVMNVSAPQVPLPHTGGRAQRKIFEEHHLAKAAWLEDEPELTLPELAARILEKFSMTIDPSTLSQHIKQMRLPLKKHIR